MHGGPAALSPRQIPSLLPPNWLPVKIPFPVTYNDHFLRWCQLLYIYLKFSDLLLMSVSPLHSGGYQLLVQLLLYCQLPTAPIHNTVIANQTHTLPVGHLQVLGPLF